MRAPSEASLLIPLVLCAATKLKVVAMLLRVSRSSKDVAERERGHRGGGAAPSKAGTRMRPFSFTSDKPKH